MASIKVDLATTENITTTYAGEAAANFIGAALLSADTIANGAIDVLENIKYKQVIPRLDVSGLIKDRSCDFVDGGTIDLTEAIIEPKELSVNVEVCKGNYRNTWQAMEMGVSANDNLAPSFADFLLQQVVNTVAAANEVSIWSGEDGTAGEFDGFETLFTNQPTQPAAQEIAGTTLSASNIVAQLGLVRSALPNTIYGKEDTQILIPISAAKFYVEAQAALGYMDRFYDGQTPLNYLGTPLVVCPGMSDNVMFGARRSNLWFGTGLLNDHQEVKLLDVSQILGGDNVRIEMNFTAGVQVGYAAEVVTYGITNTGN